MEQKIPRFPLDIESFLLGWTSERPAKEARALRAKTMRWILVGIAIVIGLMVAAGPLVLWAISLLLLPLALVALLTGGVALLLYGFGPKKEK
jgi:hypothetical protein